MLTLRAVPIHPPAGPAAPAIRTRGVRGTARRALRPAPPAPPAPPPAAPLTRPLRPHPSLQDTDGNGELDISELAGAVEQLVRAEKDRRLLKWVAAIVGAVALLTVAASAGLTFAVVALSKDVNVSGDGAMVSAATGAPLQTGANVRPGVVSALLNPELEFDRAEELARLTHVRTYGGGAAGDEDFALQRVAAATLMKDLAGVRLVTDAGDVVEFYANGTASPNARPAPAAAAEAGVPPAGRRLLALPDEYHPCVNACVQDKCEAATAAGADPLEFSACMNTYGRGCHDKECAATCAPSCAADAARADDFCNGPVAGPMCNHCFKTYPAAVAAAVAKATNAKAKAAAKAKAKAALAAGKSKGKLDIPSFAPPPATFAAPAISAATRKSCCAELCTFEPSSPSTYTN